jgi:hypothetical protein
MAPHDSEGRPSKCEQLDGGWQTKTRIEYAACPGAHCRGKPCRRRPIGIPPNKSTKSLSIPSIGTRRALMDLSVLGCTPSLPTLASTRPLAAKKVSSQEYYVANNKDPHQRQPGEKEPGTFHYNPGNMSGKTADSRKDDSDQKPDNNADTIQNRRKGQEHKTDD